MEVVKYPVTLSSSGSALCCLKQNGISTTTGCTHDRNLRSVLRRGRIICHFALYTTLGGTSKAKNRLFQSYSLWCSSNLVPNPTFTVKAPKRLWFGHKNVHYSQSKISFSYKKSCDWLTGVGVVKPKSYTSGSFDGIKQCTIIIESVSKANIEWNQVNVFTYWLP